MSKIIVTIPLTKYLIETTQDWPSPHITKTYDGSVWISDEDPGNCYEEVPEAIEFNESSAYFMLPQEIYQHINLKPGQYKTLTQVLGEIEQKESID